MAEPTIYEIITDVAQDSNGSDLDALTTAVFDKLGCPAKWRAVFHPLVHKEATSRVRRVIRDRAWDEKSASNVTPLLARGKAVAPSAVTRPQFLRDTIETFGSWGRVPFGDMTVEMHESRVAGQLKLAGGIKRDVDRHVDAINRIKAAGVTKLNDLPEYGGGAA